MKRQVARCHTEAIWHPAFMTADEVKESVSDWAVGADMWPITEIGNVVDGRLDVLLVPLGMKSPVFMGTRGVVERGHWTERLGLAGVEVKVDRGDFMKGLNEGQFERYDKDLCGLYVAGPPHIVKAKEVPPEYGVLHVGHDSKAQHIVCRRHPRWTKPKALTDEHLWRIVWAMAKEIRRERRANWERSTALERRIREKAGHAIWKAIQTAVLEGSQ